MGKVMLIVALAVLSAGCASLADEIELGSRANGQSSYTVTQWSGGKAVGTWKFKGFIHSAGDGVTFLYDGRYVHVSGDVTVIESKHSF